MQIAMFCCFKSSNATTKKRQNVDVYATTKEQQQNVDASSPAGSSNLAPYQELFSKDVLNHEVPCETKEGDLIPVRFSLLLQSKLFSDMFKDLCFSMEEEELTVQMLDGFTFPVKQISTGVFKQVVKWMEDHDGKPVPKVEDDPVTQSRKFFELSEFEKLFFAVDIQPLSEYLMAARFLDLQSMYRLGCQSMAATIQNKSPKEIRTIFGLEDDMTEEEKEAVRRKNVWCLY